MCLHVISCSEWFASVGQNESSPFSKRTFFCYQWLLPDPSLANEYPNINRVKLMHVIDRYRGVENNFEQNKECHQQCFLQKKQINECQS